MKAKYTPKNWELSSDLSIWGEAPLCSHVRIANVINHAESNGIDSHLNARIIVAGPQMLEALKTLISLDETYQNKKLFQYLASHVRELVSAIERGQV